MTCKFTRAAQHTVVDKGQFYDFDLNSVPYYFLMAHGSVDVDANPPAIEYHLGTANTRAAPFARLLADFNPLADRSNGIYETCRNNPAKTCFAVPDIECLDPQKEDCRIVMSYEGVGEEEYLFEVQAFGEYSWVGLAISSDGQMGDDDAIICKGGDYGTAESYLTYDDSQGDRGVAPAEGLFNEDSVSQFDTYLYCSFTRPSALQVTDPEDATRTISFNLNEEPVVLLAAMVRQYNCTLNEVVVQGQLDGEGEPEGHDPLDAGASLPVTLADTNPFLDAFYEGCGVTKVCKR